MKLPLAMLAASAASVATLPAQVVTTRILASAPLHAACSAGGSTNSATQPAGPLPQSGGIAASVGGTPSMPSAFAQVSWSSYDEAWQCSAELRHGLFVDQAVQGTAVSGPNDFLVEFTGTAAAPVLLEASRFSQLSPGAPWPVIAIDVDNDGTFEIPNLSANGSAVLARSVGPQPLLVRVAFKSSVPSPGHSWTTVAITARPDNSVTSVRNALGCSVAFITDPLPVFAGRGVLLIGDPQVYVIGLSLQPLLLQPAPFPSNVPWPCLLLPSPDLVLFAPNGLSLPLPDALRPVQFHVQGVYVSSGSGLWTTDGYTVTAQ